MIVATAYREACVATLLDSVFAPKFGENGAILIGLLGQGIQASRTPGMHMAEGKALGIPYEYRLIDTDALDAPLDLDGLLTRLAEVGYDGLNVTFPYKQAVIPYLTDMAESASAVGAVNTVLLRGNVRTGENTDYWGFRESLRLGLPEVRKDRVLLIGGGGAGGAVAQALLDEGTGRLMIHDTDAEKVQALVARLGDRASVVTDLAAAAGEADGIMNATPIGMAKLPGMPLDADLITPRHWVGDIIYFPLETALLKHARAIGCAVLPGSGMALYQAVRAFNLFSGLTPDPQRMWSAFEAAEKTT